MKELEMIQQIKNGDTSAFEKWIDIHSKNIERFAIQYGCPPNQAGNVTEDTFKTLHNDLESIGDEERLVENLYKIALKKLSHIQLADSSTKSIFSFEEDQQLHEKITLLDDKVKVPFILSQFHGMYTAEIARVVGMSEAVIEQHISEADTKLNKQVAHLSKRLVFIEKSYGRMSFSFNKDNVFQPTQEENEEVAPMKQPLPKRILLTWAAGIVALIAVITVPIVTGEEFQTSSDEKYIEKLYATFKEEENNKLSEAGLVDEVYTGGVLQEISYGPGAKAELERFIGELKRQNATNVKINRKKANDQFEKIIRKLELPSDMERQLFENPLTDSKEKSEEFINEFVESVTQLQSAYFIILFKYEEIFEEKMVNGELDIEKFLGEKDSYPEGLQIALDGMINQEFNLISIKDYAPIYPHYAPTDRMRDALHQDVGGYVTWLQSDPIDPYQGTTTMSLDESVDYLLEIEPTLLKSDLQTQTFDTVFGVYNSLFNNLIMNPELGPVFDRNGKIKDEYRASWRKLASNGEDLPSVYIMQKIVEEMEASNWTDSNTYSKYEHHMLEKAFSSAKQGDLHSYKLEEDQIETIIVSPKDPGYQAFVEDKYEEFSKNHSLSSLENVDPLVIVGIYYLANEREDPVTIWHLLSGSHNDISLDDFVINWLKIEPLPEEVETLYVDLGTTREGERHQYVTASYEMGNELYNFASFVSHPKYENLWTLTEIPGDAIMH